MNVIQHHIKVSLCFPTRKHLHNFPQAFHYKLHKPRRWRGTSCTLIQKFDQSTVNQSIKFQNEWRWWSSDILHCVVRQALTIFQRGLMPPPLVWLVFCGNWSPWNGGKISRTKKCKLQENVHSEFLLIKNAEGSKWCSPVDYLYPYGYQELSSC